MQGNMSPTSIRRILLHVTKYAVYSFIVGSLILMSGCSALDSFESVMDSKVDTSSELGTGQDSNVGSETNVTSNASVDQYSNTEQEQSIEEASTTIQELLDLITPLSTADAIDKYFDQYYTIVGEIREIGVDDDRGTILLKGPSLNGMGAATLFFDPPPDGFEDLQKGQVVKIKGYLDGPSYELMIHLYFFQCELVAVGPPPEEQKNNQNLSDGDDEISPDNSDPDEITEDSPNLPVNLSEPFGYYVKGDGIGAFSMRYISDSDFVLIEYYADGFPDHYRGQCIDSTFYMSCDYIDFSLDNVLDFVDDDGNSVLRFDAYESYITITASEPICGVPVEQLNGNYYCKLRSSVPQ